MAADGMTRHGAARVAKRQGVGKGAAQKVAGDARRLGTPRDDTHGNLRRFLDSKFHKHAGALLIVYAGNVYVFASKSGPLITMYPLPGNLKHKKASRDATRAEPKA